MQPWVGTQTPQNAAGSTGTSVSIDISGALVDELVYCIIYLGDAQTAQPTITGWNVEADQSEGTTGGSSSRLSVFSRKKQVGDTTFTVSWSVSCRYQVLPISWRGVDPTQSPDGIAFANHTTGTSYVTGSSIPNDVTYWAVGIFGSRGSTAVVPWTGDAALKNRSDGISSSNPFIGLMVEDSNGPVTAVSHSYTATGQTASHGISLVMYLIPGVSGIFVSDPDYLALESGLGAVLLEDGTALINEA